MIGQSEAREHCLRLGWSWGRQNEWHLPAADLLNTPGPDNKEWQEQGELENKGEGKGPLGLESLLCITLLSVWVMNELPSLAIEFDGIFIFILLNCKINIVTTVLWWL